MIKFILTLPIKLILLPIKLILFPIKLVLWPILFIAKILGKGKKLDGLLKLGTLYVFFKSDKKWLWEVPLGASFKVGD